MSSIVAIVGRPNVGKSTLFNRLVRERKAIVSPIPGVTRDRLYAEVVREEKRFFLIDTGGFEPASSERMITQIREQAQLAIEEADLILHLLDGKDGLVPMDLEINNHLRRADKPIIHVVNKVDNPRRENSIPEFYQLGVEQLLAISAEHAIGIESLLEEIFAILPESETIGEDTEQGPSRIAVVGRPNVGKSSLTNRILGYQRVVVDSTPGTTRDAVDTPFQYKGKKHVIIDTAGIRRKNRISSKVETYSILRSLKAIDRSHVIVLLLDGPEGLTHQDARVASYAEERGKGCIIAANKWDLVEPDNKEARERSFEKIRYRLKYIPYVPLLRISAKTGWHLGDVLEQIQKVSAEHRRRVATPQLNRVLQEITERHSHPLHRNRKVKFFYASQIQIRPPTFAIVTNYPEAVSRSYERFLMNQIREHFGFQGSPIKIRFRPRSQKPSKKLAPFTNSLTMLL